MKTIQIPGTDVICSNMCLGPATLGALIDEKASFEILDFYYENGGNLLDTAHVYCDWLNMGKSTNEKLIGKWLTTRNLHHKMLVATKGGHYAFATPEVSRVTKKELLIDIQESLKYLQTECIDFYWLHRDNLGLPAGEILEFLNDFKKQGLIKWFGGSNWTVERLKEAASYAESHKIQGLSGVQNLWTLASVGAPLGDPTCVVSTQHDIQYYRESGLPLFAYTSQANGFFTKLAATGADSLPDHVKNTYLNQRNLHKLEVVKELASKYQCTINDIVLAYLTSQDFTCIPVFNCSRIEQLQDTLKCCDLRLSAQELASLELKDSR